MKKTGLRIALIHNLKPARKDPNLPADYYSECDSRKTIRGIARTIRQVGHTVFPVEADDRLPGWLRKHRVDLAFNIAEGFHGPAREARVPALLELMGIPYTGSGVLALALALDKAKSKQLFRYAGIPTPNFQLFFNSNEPLERHLHFPLIVKPNHEGSGKGIWASSVVQDEKSLRVQVKKVFELYGQEAIVEEYIEGTELTVGILGADEILPILEIDFSDCKPSGEYFYSWRMKEFQGNEALYLTPRFWCPARLSAEVTRAVGWVASKAARVLGVRDFGRVDVRLSSEGIPYVLEANPLPGLDPEESNLPLIAKAAGISYPMLIERIIRLAVERTPELKGRILTAPSLPSKNGAPSSIPSSGEIHPKASLRPLADPSMERPSGSAASPAVMLRGLPKKRGRALGNDSKEERLGR